MVAEMKKNNKGQALFEFIIFLPFVVVLFKMFLNIGGAINGSINQQKALRGYYFYLNRGNSYYPDQQTLNVDLPSFSQVGFLAIGYSERLQSNITPMAPCYKIEPFFGDDFDKCLEVPRENKSQFIKPKTMFGLCGAVFVNNSGTWSIENRTSGTCNTR